MVHTLIVERLDKATLFADFLSQMWMQGTYELVHPYTVAYMISLHIFIFEKHSPVILGVGNNNSLK